MYTSQGRRRPGSRDRQLRGPPPLGDLGQIAGPIDPAMCAELPLEKAANLIFLVYSLGKTADYIQPKDKKRAVPVKPQLTGERPVAAVCAKAGMRAYSKSPCGTLGDAA